jgi:hypothetical protein
VVPESEEDAMIDDAALRAVGLVRTEHRDLELPPLFDMPRADRLVGSAPVISTISALSTSHRGDVDEGAR